MTLNWKKLAGLNTGHLLCTTDHGSMTNSIWMIFDSFIPRQLYSLYGWEYAKNTSAGKRTYIEEGGTRELIRKADVPVYTFGPYVRNPTIILFDTVVYPDDLKNNVALIRPYARMLSVLGAVHYFLDSDLTMVVGYAEKKGATLKGCVGAVMGIRKYQDSENYDL